MPPRQPKSKDFAALKKEWDHRLAASGFHDIEDSAQNLKEYTESIFRNRPDSAWIESKTEYFRLAGHFLNEHTFAGTVEKQIWAYHAEGLSIREIVTALKLKGIKSYRNGVHLTLKALIKIMFEKYKSRG